VNVYDIIIVGLGTAGSATCMTLARRGLKVLGIDRYRPPHTMASHHGESRSVRRAYLEGTTYVPMAMRSWELWRKLERDSGQNLLATTGNLTIGQHNSPAVSGFFKSAESHDIPHQFLTAAEIRKKWPEIDPPDTFVGGLEKEAGIVFPEKSIAAFLAEAAKAGAHLIIDDEVKGWTEKNGSVFVSTATGIVQAGRLLVTAGAWTKRLLHLPDQQLMPQRVPVHWFAPPKVGNYQLGHFPVNFWQAPRVKRSNLSSSYREFYSLPVTQPKGRIKIAFHNGLEECDPDAICREVTAGEVEEMREMVFGFLPGLRGSAITSEVCLYTMTPDGHFYLGKRPGSTNIFAAAFAGHGFKFAPVLGEILADMLVGETPAFDLSLFSPERFSLV
jgi:sarcosine oxidase